MNRAWVVAAAYLMVVGTAAAGHQYHYFDEPRPLQLDVTRIAVAHDAVPIEAGVAAGAVEPWTLPGWSMVQVPDAERTEAGVEALVTVAAAAPAIAFASPVFVGDDGGPVFVTPHLLVGFRDGIDAPQAVVILDGAGRVLDADWMGMPGVYRVRSESHNGFDVLAAANTLAQRPEVLFAEPDMAFTGRGAGLPNDPGFPSCWGLHNTGQFGGIPGMDMNCPEAWDGTTGDPSIIVLIIDTGVDQAHPDIRQIPGTDTTGEPGVGGPVNACDNHGTAVAGCVSAIINNNLGTVGSAPGCTSASARAFVSNPSCDGSWSGVASMTVAALTWGQDNGVRVTNNSNFYGFTSSAIAQKYQLLFNAGIVHFSSAGNFSEPIITYPASLPSVNAVAALNDFGVLAGFSNYGPGLSISAPGDFIYTTDRTGPDGWSGGDYTFASGTSFASPYTAGVAALVLSVDPTLASPDVEFLLRSTAMDLGPAGYDEFYGWGFVNAAAAVAAAGCDDLTDDCNGNGVSDLCEIVQGQVPDCNGNGVPDDCDVAGGGDLNGNGVPDDCEPDCNGNALPDDLDIDDGTSADCNGNGVPDECDIAAGTSPDCNGNGAIDACDVAAGDSADFNHNVVPDECECPADLVAIFGQVNTTDFLVLLSLWGPCPAPCPADINADGQVGVQDMLYLLGHWGACP